MNSTASQFQIDCFISDLSMRRTNTASGSLENLKGHHEELYPHYHLVMSRHSIYIRTVSSIYRTIFLKWSVQGLVFWGILKGQESKIWALFALYRSSWGPQKFKNFYFLKLKNKNVDNDFNFFYKLTSNKLIEFEICSWLVL